VPAPAQTSTAAVVSAARELLERVGPDGLTMQAVAEAVGVRAPSLYKRVPDRAGLLRLVIEDAAAELVDTFAAAAATGEPRDDLRALLEATRAFSRQRPKAFALIFAPGAQPEAARQVAEQTSTDLLRVVAALVGQEQSLPAARTVVAWALGFISMEQAGAFRLGGDVDAAWDYGINLLTRALDPAP
jgi:AcrR family transcriptional regulator